MGRKKFKDDKDDWTNEELQLKNGYCDLCKSIVKQWVRDGQPKSDYEYIKNYIYIYKKIQEMKVINHEKCYDVISLKE